MKKPLVLSMLVVLAACGPTPINHDVRWDGDPASRMVAPAADAPRFECAVNEIDWFSTDAPLVPIAEDVPTWGFRKVAPDLVQLAAEDIEAAELRLQNAYSGKRPLLVDQCLPLAQRADYEPPSRSTYFPIRSQRQLAYHVANLQASNVDWKRLACLTVLACGKDDNPFTSEDRVAALRPYLQRGLQRAAAHPQVAMLLRANLGKYDMQAETYQLDFETRDTPSIDTWGEYGGTPGHHYRQHVEGDSYARDNDPAEDNYSVQLPTRDNTASVTLAVSKSQARGVENVVGIQGGRQVLVVAYGKVESIAGKQVTFRPTAMQANVGSMIASADPLYFQWEQVREK